MALLALANGRILGVVVAKILEALVEYLTDVKSFVFRLYLGMLEANSLFSPLAPGNLTPCVLVCHLLNAKALVMWLALVLVAASPSKPMPDYSNSRVLAFLAALFPALGVTLGNSQVYLQQVSLLRKSPFLIAGCPGMALLKTVPPEPRMVLLILVSLVKVSLTVVVAQDQAQTLSQELVPLQTSSLPNS